MVFNGSHTSYRRVFPARIECSLLRDLYGYLHMDTCFPLQPFFLGNFENVYVKYMCPRMDWRMRLAVFRENLGFNNSYSHLKSFHWKGLKLDRKSKRANELFNKDRSEMIASGGTIWSHFSVHSLFEYEKAVYGWFRMVFIRNTPLWHVMDIEACHWFCHNIDVSKNTLVKVIFYLVQLVEERITPDIWGTKGAVIFDGYYNSGMSYVAVFASYSNRRLARKNFVLCVEFIPLLSILSISPMSQRSFDDVSEEESTAFDAEALLYFFRDMFYIFGHQFDR